MLMGKHAAIWAFGLALACTACSDDAEDDHGDGDHEQDQSAVTADSGSPRADSSSAIPDPEPKDAGGSAGTAAGTDAGGDGGSATEMTFFVTSEGSMNGNLGGLAGADARCERLAQAAGAGDKTWRAYLSAERTSASDDAPVHARDRIGDGPWHNAKGMQLAADLTALHALASGNAELFLDEKGQKVNGQWAGSPTPSEHDILTGSTAAGMVMAGKTCGDWTSDSAMLAAQVGHSDGLGPMMNPNPPYNSWNSSHENGGCNDTAPRGGAGHVYCFASD